MIRLMGLIRDQAFEHEEVDAEGGRDQPDLNHNKHQDAPVKDVEPQAHHNGRDHGER